MSKNKNKPERWRDWITHAVSDWLAVETRAPGAPLIDFARLCEHLRPADVILVEGRTRVSGIIQSVTLSSWTHAALYIGRLSELGELPAKAREQTRDMAPDTLLLVEAELGRGVHLSPVSRYAHEHLRLCRPKELSADDTRAVIAYALAQLGTPYDLRQITDLLRFFFPYGLLPRRWRSSLFEIGHGEIARTICSTLIARAFFSVRYPILPVLHRGTNGGTVFHHRDARLFTPRDFDYSPYFDIIKYPFFGDDINRYRELDWDDESPG